MQVHAVRGLASDTDADTIVVGVFDDEAPHNDALRALVESGEARRSHGAVALTHDGGRRWLLAGLGAREEFDAERARVSAAKVAQRAAELHARRLCWELPEGCGEEVAAALVEGTLLASYRFDRYLQEPADEAERPARLEALTV